ncbi:hypothetical protein PUN28_009275 [Cardiocondyla obscurior]|uniref:Uncharacterized protein n=1 Tax=Cardiocondyla obscurior TaxID=286306 RepID=A0AAW2FT02_9HYME
MIVRGGSGLGQASGGSRSSLRVEYCIICKLIAVETARAGGKKDHYIRARVTRCEYTCTTSSAIINNIIIIIIITRLFIRVPITAVAFGGR